MDDENAAKVVGAAGALDEANAAKGFWNVPVLGGAAGLGSVAPSEAVEPNAVLAGFPKAGVEPKEKDPEAPILAPKDDVGVEPKVDVDSKAEVAGLRRGSCEASGKCVDDSVGGAVEVRTGEERAAALGSAVVETVAGRENSKGGLPSDAATFGAPSRDRPASDAAGLTSKSPAIAGLAGSALA